MNDMDELLLTMLFGKGCIETRGGFISNAVFSWLFCPIIEDLSREAAIGM